MFMQILNSTTKQYANFNGQTYYKKNNIDWSGGTDPTRNFNGPLLDPGVNNAVGFGFEYAGNTVSSLPLDAGSSVPVPPWAAPSTSDTPSFQVPDDFSPKTVTATDSFSMYLMYQSNVQSSVWIALSELDWSWTETATNNGTATNPQWTGSQSQQPGATTKKPSGAAAFPTWVNLTPNFTDVTKNPWRLAP
jgi:hypothetical protein